MKAFFQTFGIAFAVLLSGCATARVHPARFSPPAVQPVQASVARAVSHVSAARSKSAEIGRVLEQAKVSVDRAVCAVPVQLREELEQTSLLLQAGRSDVDALTRELMDATAALMVSQEKVDVLEKAVSRQTDALNSAILQKNDALAQKDQALADKRHVLFLLWRWRIAAALLLAVMILWTLRRPLAALWRLPIPIP